MKVIITAGGTGGHIYPALSIIDKIKEMEPKSEFIYVGTTTRMEKDIVPKLGIKYVGIEMYGLSKNVLHDMKVLFLVMKCERQMKKLMKEFSPDVVIGAGGYVTFPVIMAAKSLGIKTFIHEQNSIPGKSNRMLSKIRYITSTRRRQSLQVILAVKGHLPYRRFLRRSMDFMKTKNSS